MPEFPTLEDTSLVQEMETVVFVNKDYWVRLMKYIVDCEKTFSILQEFDKLSIIE